MKKKTSHKVSNKCLLLGHRDRLGAVSFRVFRERRGDGARFGTREFHLGPAWTRC